MCNRLQASKLDSRIVVAVTLRLCGFLQRTIRLYKVDTNTQSTDFVDAGDYTAIK